ncbi:MULTISPECIES: hypothetical protein [Ramlibacter]|uniref:Uncharacterized protein n=1 Tax=Ramlibacter aquaticus TaxID=2780094 RepID=A0ABR9SCP1_9BURK|nr:MULTISPECIES: hypothetical protein [Ramlibacter]MBE7940116.1 hypothetical protein [Ramlibacter aquaticus]
MSRATVAKRDAERAHVTVDSGMGLFYKWFSSSDRRYRARELVYLARVGFDFLQQKGKEPGDVAVAAPLPVSAYAPFPVSAPAALPVAGVASPVTGSGPRKGPIGFDDLLSFDGS